MKFCPNCGNQLEDSAIFCANCGTNVGAPVTTQNVIQDYNNLAVTQKNKKIGIIAVAAAGALILILLFTLIFGSNNYEEVIDNVFSATFEGEADKIEEFAPDKFWEFYEMEKGNTVDQEIEDFKERFEREHKYLTMELGENIKFDYEIVNKTEVSTTKVKEFAEYLNENYDLEESSVKEAYKLKLKYSISGDDKEKSDEITFYILKIDSDWYPIDDNGNFNLAAYYGFD